MLKALTITSSELESGDRWVIDVELRDDDGYLADVEPVITVTSPAAVVTTPTVTQVSFGVYRTVVTPAVAGKWTAVAAATDHGTKSFTTYVVTGATFPTVTDIRDYATSVGQDQTDGWEDEEIQSAIDAEASQQRKRCDVGAVYPADLSEALKRRVMRSLAMRSIITPTELVGDAAENVDVVPFNDPEIRRLENPYRKVVML